MKPGEIQFTFIFFFPYSNARLLVIPIRPDFVGKNFPTNLSEHIIVKMNEIDKVDEILKVVK